MDDLFLIIKDNKVPAGYNNPANDMVHNQYTKLAFLECRNNQRKLWVRYDQAILYWIQAGGQKIRGTSSRRLGTRWKWVRYAGQEAHAISCMGILLSQM